MSHRKKRFSLLLIAGLLSVSGCAKKVDDYGQIPAMRRFAETALARQGASLRPAAKQFEEYKVNLPFYMRPFFVGNPIEIHLLTYQSARLAVASFTQMEAPPGGSYFLDLAYQLRPASNLRAPIFHGDVIKPMPGVDGMFAVDFYNLNPRDIDVDKFLGEQAEEVKRVLEMVAPYQKTEATGRGKLTPHLKPWKSKYRIELKEPDVADAKSHRAYFEAVRQAFEITLGAYLTALERVKPDTDPEVIKRNQAGGDLLIDTLDQNDIAAKLAKWMFGKDYHNYFFKGFWGKGEYGAYK